MNSPTPGFQMLLQVVLGHLPRVTSNKSPRPPAPQFPHSYTKAATLTPAAIICLSLLVINSDNSQDPQRTEHWGAAPVAGQKTSERPDRREQAGAVCPAAARPSQPPPNVLLQQARRYHAGNGGPRGVPRPRGGRGEEAGAAAAGLRELSLPGICSSPASKYRCLPLIPAGPTPPAPGLLRGWKRLPLTRRRAPGKAGALAVLPQPEALIKPSTARRAGPSGDSTMRTTAPDTCFKKHVLAPRFLPSTS